MQHHSSVLHQTLHGYKDGHRLIAKSLNLPAGIEQSMLVLSDWSGHGKVAHFDEYITGYPLNEIGYYALAKTWYASEMSRPGCVWTHTMLIPFAMLASTDELHAFSNYFDRPNGQNFNQYDEPLLSGMAERAPPPLPEQLEVSVEELAGVIFRLYESPIAPVLVPVESPAEIERAFFAIWAQQWPRLRRSFTFCTGAIGGRRLGKRWFDLQGIPFKRIDELNRSIDYAAVAPIGHPDFPVADVPWLRTTMRDLSNPKSGGLRDFLFEFGAEADSDRGAFAELVNIYINLSNQASVAENAERLVGSIEAVFPDSAQGSKFKQWLLSKSTMANDPNSAVGKFAFLLFADAGTFDLQGIDLVSIIKDAWSKNSTGLVDTLEVASQRHKKQSSAVLAALAEALQPSEVARLADSAMPTALALFSHRPMLLAHSAFRELESRDDQLVDHVSKKRTTKADIRKVLEVWISEHNFHDIQRSARQNPKGVVSTLLDILAVSPRVLEGFEEEEWRDVFYVGGDVVIEWVRAKSKRIIDGKLSLRVLALAVVSVAADVLPIDASVAKVWAHLSMHNEELSSEPWLQKGMMLRLYQRAMHQPDEEGARIATLTFPFIYLLPMRRVMSQSEWEELRRTVGDSEWYLDWDWCRRIREGLIDRFIDFSWPVKYFAEMLDNHEVASSILDAFYYRSRYRKFLKKVAA